MNTGRERDVASGQASGVGKETPSGEGNVGPLKGSNNAGGMMIALGIDRVVHVLHNLFESNIKGYFDTLYKNFNGSN